MNCDVCLFVCLHEILLINIGYYVSQQQYISHQCLELFLIVLLILFLYKLDDVVCFHRASLECSKIEALMFIFDW